jgi:hypothetical protein
MLRLLKRGFYARRRGGGFAVCQNVNYISYMRIAFIVRKIAKHTSAFIRGNIQLCVGFSVFLAISPFRCYN